MLNLHASGPFVIVVLTFLISGYFLPTILAASRHRQTASVVLVNLLFGWTFVGWLLVLYLAMRERQPVPQAG